MKVVQWMEWVYEGFLEKLVITYEWKSAGVIDIDNGDDGRDELR